MRLALRVPYADVRAADLVLALGAPTLPPMGELTVPLGAFALTLGVLGHSHQALLRGPGVELRERVACRPGAPGDLPAGREEDLGTHRYAFTSQVLPLTRERSARLCAAVAADPRGLVGVFGTDPDAFTALRALAPDDGDARAHAAAWETWHAYPQTGELVRTTGTVGPA